MASNEPKKVLGLINELKGLNKTPTDPSITPTTWKNHFEDLNKLDPDFSGRSKALDNLLKEAEMKTSSIFNELDYKITNSVISKAISKLKSGKSAGIDRISNEMLNMVKFI